MSIERSIYSAEERAILDEVDNEFRTEQERDNPVAQRFSHTVFISRSKGVGRRRQKPIEVELVIDKHTKKSHLIKQGEVISPVDQLAEETLADSLPYGVDPYEYFLECLRRLD